jgi:hypothetical protein
MPAYVKEGADRAFRYSLARSEGNLNDVTISTADLCHAMDGLRPQLELMQSVEKKEEPITLDDLIRNAVADGSLDHHVRDWDPRKIDVLKTEAHERARKA